MRSNRPRVPIIAPIAPKRVVFVLYDGFQPLDLAGPWQAFSSANEEAEAALYQLGTVAAEPVVATWDQGLRMQVDCTSRKTGWSGRHDRGARRPRRGAPAPMANARLVRRATPARAARSVCTGAFLLACAGLLDGRVVTTHWRSADRLRHVPALRVEDDRLYVDSGKYWTSAGVSAGIDLALALIERDHGPELSQQVARRLVVFAPRRRPAPVQPDPAAAGPPARRSASWCRRWRRDCRPAGRSTTWPTPGMSRRTFQRKFIAHFGVAPTKCCACCGERAGAVQATGKMSKKEMERHLGPMG